MSNLSIEEWTYTNKKIPEKDGGAVCGSNNIDYLCNIIFFLIPLFIILAPLSRSLPVVTQIRGHIAGPPPPFPLWHVPSFLSREEVSISLLVDSRRIVPTHAARRSQQLIPFLFAFLQIKSKLIMVRIKLKDKQTL